MKASAARLFRLPEMVRALILRARRPVLLFSLLVCAAPGASAQSWFFAWDGATDFSCAPSADGNNPFFQSEPGYPTCYWEIVDNGAGGKALRQFANDPSKTMRWRGHGSRPEYYRGPCDAFSMENFKPGRQAFTLAFRLKVNSYNPSASGTRIFNCEYQTTITNAYSTNYPTYTFRIEFCVRLSGGNLILQDFRTGDVLGTLKQGSQPAGWHTVWAVVTVPPRLNQVNGIYRLWFDGVEVNWGDRDKGGWSDCEFGSNDRIGDISWDYLCYDYNAWLPGEIAPPGETPRPNTNAIAGLKLFADGTPCELTNKMVAALYVDPALAMTNYFIAEPDGSEGIRVRHNTGLSPKTAGGTPVSLQVGDIVTVRGGLMSPACEKQVSAHEIIRTGAAGGSLSAPPVLSNGRIAAGYHQALYEAQPAQVLVNALTGTLASVSGTLVADPTQSWTPGVFNHRTIYFPATASRGDRYYYVYTNSANTLDLRHRTIEFNLPNLAAENVKIGDPYQFVGGLAAAPRLEGRRVGTRGTVVAVNDAAGYFDVNDGTVAGEARTLQDIWDRVNYPNAWVPPAGLRIKWTGAMPAPGQSVTVKGCLGAEHFKYQVSTTINGSARDEVRIDRVFPFLAADSVASWAPPWLSAWGLTATGFVANVVLTPGEPYRMLASSNLLDWVDMASFVSAGTNYLFVDPAALDQPQRYYRVVSP